jgi:fused signal recognition particle receptor
LTKRNGSDATNPKAPASIDSPGPPAPRLRPHRRRRRHSDPHRLMFNLKEKLQRTRDSLVAPLRRIFQRDAVLGEKDRTEIEELLLGADVGVEACDRIMEALRDRAPGSDARQFLREEFMGLLAHPGLGAAEVGSGTRAIMVIGVNGVGKTTSIAKLAHYLRGRGREVLLAACDTFRAAAVEQLSIWAERAGVELIRHREGGDPAAVAFDACTAGKSRGVDVVIIDTAGRLHTRVNLMEELKKIRRVCAKVLGPGGVETYLVLDATLGQNSLVQAAEFTRSLPTDGIILTKLDSTAKGGIVIAVRQKLGIPVKFIGVGEELDDFAEFSAAEFVDALLG